MPPTLQHVFELHPAEERCTERVPLKISTSLEQTSKLTPGSSKALNMQWAPGSGPGPRTPRRRRPRRVRDGGAVERLRNTCAPLARGDLTACGDPPVVTCCRCMTCNKFMDCGNTISCDNDCRMALGDTTSFCLRRRHRLRRPNDMWRPHDLW